MSLEYYLFCKKKYENILLQLDDILGELSLIVYETHMNDDNLDLLDHPSISIFIEQKKAIVKVMNIVTEKIGEMCVHEFENDTIDISLERSLDITYCKHCGFTK